MNSYIDRLFDLLPLVRANFYHPGMRGSFSIKAVLPVVAPNLDYQALGDVSGGTEAQVAWLRATSPDCGARELGQIRASLLRYCAQDTWAMVEVAYFLAGKPRPVRPD
jgi:predicted RecB family nuclease